MSTDVHDLRATIIPRSDQLNSEQLLGGPMILTVTEVRAGGGEDQPVSIFYEADPGRPYKPCKTMRKVLILAWGPDGTQWVGRSMELYCDPSVKFGGDMVGGIRISRLTDIPKDIKVSLTATKGRKAMHEIGLLQLSAAVQKVLKAIEAANNGESLKKARALAETLESGPDIAMARAAYAKRVAELKAKGPAQPPKPSPVIDPDDDPSVGADDVTFTFDQVKQRIESADSLDVLDLARDQIAGVKDEGERAYLNDLAGTRASALGKGS